MRRAIVTVRTAADGSATAYSPGISGKIHSVHYIKDGSNAFADGVDFTITAENSGEGIWTETNVNAQTVRYPRAPTHSQAGAAALYASGGVGVLDKIALAADRVKVVIAQGGNAKDGKFYVLYE